MFIVAVIFQKLATVHTPSVDFGGFASGWACVARLGLCGNVSIFGWILHTHYWGLVGDVSDIGWGGAGLCQSASREPTEPHPTYHRLLNIWNIYLLLHVVCFLVPTIPKRGACERLIEGNVVFFRFFHQSRKQRGNNPIGICGISRLQIKHAKVARGWAT